MEAIATPADHGLSVDIVGRPVSNGRGEELFETRSCRTCGQMFHTYDLRLRYCSDKCRPHDRAEQARIQREYMEKFTPEQKKAIAHENYINYIKPNGKRTTISCTVCHKSYQRSLNAETRPDFICAKCQRAIRLLALPKAYCNSCGEESGYANGKPLAQCNACYSAQTGLAEYLDVSRQRVGQLVHKEIDRAAIYGETITIAEAIRRVAAIRAAKKAEHHD